MFGGRRKTALPVAEKHSALDELLATEQEIAGHMAAAERACALLLDTARADAATIERDAAAALETEIAALTAHDADARIERVHRMEGDAASLVTHYRTLGESEIAALAAYACSEISGLTPVPAP